jgi:hypothetical protein
VSEPQERLPDQKGDLTLSFGLGLLCPGPCFMPSIHPSTWSRCPPKSRCRFVHSTDPMEPGNSATPVSRMMVNATYVSPAWISALVNGTGERRRRLKSLVGSSPRRFWGPSSACYIWFAKEPGTRNLRTLDPSLTLTRTQHSAVLGKRGNNQSFIYAGFAISCNAQQPLTAHS